MIGMALAFILMFQNAASVRPGAVAGQLRTVEGSPAVSIRVSLIPAPIGTIKPSDGGEYYYRQPAVSTTLTDAQGRFRLTNVPAGRYFLVSGITYHPTTLDADRATVVTVTPDSTADNMNFQLLRPLGGKVSGRLTPRPENPQQRAILSGVQLDEILEIPVAADGAFEFGHVPKGTYLIDLVPPFPGLGSFRVQVGDTDLAGLEIRRPATHAVNGRIVVQNGPLPRALLAFSSSTSYVSVPINPDGTFTAKLHSAQHRVELAGMPGGYSVLNVRTNSSPDASQGLVMGSSDLSGVVITVAAPRQLPHVRGRVTGLPAARLASAKVELSGPIVGSLEAAVSPDGSFEFASATPGNYRLRLPQVPELAPMYVVVTWSDADVQVAVPGR
jgi:hypothetical protein